MSAYRYSIGENTSTITRARAYRLPEHWTTDAWSNYFDGDFVGFYEEYYRGRRPLNDDDDCERAISAYQSAQNYGQDTSSALRKVAQRITGQWDADFICVGLDRGRDFYVLAWGGDPENEWRDEIEALNDGDIWRIECEEYQPGFGVGGGDWVHADEYPDEFYGEDKATAEFERLFPETEFPAERFIVGSA